MVELYNYCLRNTRSGDVYDKILAFAKNPEIRCPFCGGISNPSQIDHFLPKSRYGHFSVFPYNLIPICKDCNTEFKKEFLGGNDLPDVYGEIIPCQMQYISKLQNSILDLAINFFAPTYAKEVSNEEITDSDIVKNDSFPELDSVFGKEEMTTTKTTFVPDDDTITSEETDELVNFLNSKE